ncbi:hypothetical protein HZB01_00415 [Candidatus Woesearchaeota archaeon]|nr:hypothetical protein [Candidatus Woesearchaeota archaeon]
MKKYKLDIVNSKTNEDHQMVVVNINIYLNKKEELFDHGEIMYLVAKLGLKDEYFDYIYDGTDIREFSSNTNFDFCLYFLDKCKTIFLFIITKNENAKKQLDKLLEDLKNIEEGDFLR